MRNGYGLPQRCGDIWRDQARTVAFPATSELRQALVRHVLILTPILQGIGKERT